MSSKQWHGGKGDSPRIGNDEAYRSNWDRIFGGIDYNSLNDGNTKQYHSENDSQALSPGKNFSDKKPDPLTKQINNGENK